MTKQKLPIDGMTFEKALAELNDIVAKMEEGEVPLQESIEQYERAMKLHQKCIDDLAAAKLKVEQLLLDSNKNIIGKKNFLSDDDGKDDDKE